MTLKKYIPMEPFCSQVLSLQLIGNMIGVCSCHPVGWHRGPLFIDEDTDRQVSEARQNLIRISETVSQFHPELGKPISQIHLVYFAYLGLPWWLNGKESACNAGVLGSITGAGRFLGGGNGNPLQYSYLENSMERGAWQATGALAQSSLCAKEPLRPCKESDTTEYLN